VPYAFNPSTYYMMGCANTVAGYFALHLNTTGAGNTAAGAGALYANTTGQYNTATGLLALFRNTTGGYNAATGSNALFSNTTGSFNVATGESTLSSNTTGAHSVAAGYQALNGNTSGSYNVATGFNALSSNTTGAYNVAVGALAGSALATGNYNTYIGYNALAITNNDNYVTVVGVPNAAATTYISGIYNTTGLSGLQVGVTSAGQLFALAPSSERFKTDIATMGSSTEKLQQLHPVTFHYKNDAEGTLRFGLIAEEVAKVYPELVVRDENGRIDGVRYDELAPMLLNEVQKQQVKLTEIDELKQQIAELRQQNQAMQAALLKLKSKDQLIAQR
jgi:Chaperone of endosialidase